jgi:hypothetical protein
MSGQLYGVIARANGQSGNRKRQSETPTVSLAFTANTSAFE